MGQRLVSLRDTHISTQVLASHTRALGLCWALQQGLEMQHSHAWLAEATAWAPKPRWDKTLRKVQQGGVLPWHLDRDGLDGA